MYMYETTKFPLKLYFLNLNKFSAWVYPQKVGSVFTLHTCRSASFCLKPSVWRRLLWLPHQALTQVFLHLWRDPACKTAQLPYGIFTKNQQNPSNQPTKTKTSQQHNDDNKTPKPEQKQKKPQTNSILKTNKNPQATPASSLLPCDFVFAFSLCSPVQQIYSSNQFLISWVVFYFFLVPQMYFSCVKSAHKCLQVSNCPCCLSAVTALFPLAELQHRSQQLL